MVVIISAGVKNYYFNINKIRVMLINDGISVVTNGWSDRN